jgi:hypoxanthine phosphoribosyltransferase
MTIYTKLFTPSDDHTVLLYARKLNIPHPGTQTLLSWAEFGFGIELLMQQIRGAGSRFEVDAVIGINEAGLSIAAFLSGGLMHRCPIGFIRNDSKTIREEWLPSVNSVKSVLLVDVEIKSGSTLKAALQIIRKWIKPKRVFFACLGAQVNSTSIGTEIRLNELEAYQIIRKSRLAGFFVALIGPRPSLEPPLYLD